MKCPSCHFDMPPDNRCMNGVCIVNTTKVSKDPPLPDRLLWKYEEIKLPGGLSGGLLGDERIVGIVNFRGDVIIATERRILRMSHDAFTEVKLEQLEAR